MLFKADAITVVIPAAGPVPEGVLALSNISCPAMIPVAGRPVIHWTMSYLIKLGLRKFIVAVSRRDLFIEDFVRNSFGHETEVEFIVPVRGGALGETLLELVEAVETESTLVVLGDTHFQFRDAAILDRETAVVLTSKVEESYRWCTVEKDDKGYITKLYDKVAEVGSPPNDALVGVYFFPRTESIRSTIAEVVDEQSKSGSTTPMARILERFRDVEPILTVDVSEWLDCGNADRQAESHRSLLQKREFNELQIDPVLGTVTKRSRNVAKFVDEINYLRLLPPQLSVLFPRVVDYSIEWASPFVTMEYYGYSSLAEAFLFENIDPGIWEQVFSHILQILQNGFQAFPRPIGVGEIKLMYVDKMLERMSHLDKNDVLMGIINSPSGPKINGKRMPTRESLIKILENCQSWHEKQAVGCIMHGDLCFSNILYDFRSRVCKLIDPRGSFGSKGIFGDSCYDVAKLYHSCHGLYDFLTNDLYRLSVHGSEVSLDFCKRPQHTEICKRFENVFMPHFDRNHILVLTGILFLSMPALHYDCPKRQVAMFARGLELLSEGLN